MVKFGVYVTVAAGAATTLTVDLLKNGSSILSPVTDTTHATGVAGVWNYCLADPSDIGDDWQVEVADAAPAGRLLTRLQAEGLFVGRS